MTSARQNTILLVDDRNENLLALEAILEALGHQLLRATSGPQALKHLLATDVSLILLDVQMPEMDGYETAAHIKSRQRTADIPIIFLTAIDREAHLAYRGYAAGAVDFLAKPFDPWVLRAKVEVFLRLRQERQELAAQVAALTRRLEAAGPDRMQRVLERVERLLVMAGDEHHGSGPALQALAEVQALRTELGTPGTLAATAAERPAATAAPAAERLAATATPAATGAAAELPGADPAGP